MARASVLLLIAYSATVVGAQEADSDPLPQSERPEADAAQEAGSALPPLLPDLTPIPDDDAGPGADGTVGPAVSTFDFVRMVLVLAAVVGAIYLIFFLIRRGSAARVNENDLITLLGSKTLGGNRNLHLVRVGTGVYLVGAADESINLLAEITDKESLDSIQLDSATALASPSRRSFTDVLGELFQGARRSQVAASQGDSFLERQRQRVERLRPDPAGER